MRLVNTCGVGIAMELELMGEPVTAQRAREIHLVNRVVPREELMPCVEDIAAKILRNPRAAVESAKDTILECLSRSGCRPGASPRRSRPWPPRPRRPRARRSNGGTG